MTAPSRPVNSEKYNIVCVMATGTTPIKRLSPQNYNALGGPINLSRIALGTTWGKRFTYSGHFRESAVYSDGHGKIHLFPNDVRLDEEFYISVDISRKR